jgi:hypothetical protein
MWAVNTDRHRSDVVWRTCEPGPGQSKTAERGQTALRVWMIHKSERLAGEGTMRESKGKRRSHARARGAAGYRCSNRSSQLCRRLFPTTQYYRTFLARFSDERSLWNGPIRSCSKVAARPLTCQLTSRCRVFSRKVDSYSTGQEVRYIYEIRKSNAVFTKTRH